MKTSRKKQNENGIGGDSDTLLSKENTLWLQGASAIVIMLLHYICQIECYPRIANIPAGVGVAIFLFISGFGINESYKAKGLSNYWVKRVRRVLIPYWIVVLVQLPFWNEIDPERLFREFCFTGSSLWFIDYIMRWYIVYWISRKIMPKHSAYILIGYAIYSMTLEQLMSEQSLSFLCGYLASEYYASLRKLKRGQIVNISSVCIIISGCLYAIKSLPVIQDMKGALPFNILLLNCRLILAVAVIPFPYIFPCVKNRFMNFLGKISYEIYIVHVNFMSLILGRIVNIVVFSVSSICISAIFNVLNEWLKSGKQRVCVYSICIYVGIAYLLATKYCMRITPDYGYFTIMYLCVITCICVLLLKGKCDRLLSSDKIFWVCFSCFAVAVLIVQYSFDPMLNKVDRWSALAYPIQNLLNGEFPYLAKTHLGGYASPLPVWQIFHIPFYFLGNVGLSEIFTLLLFIMSVKYLYGTRIASVSMVLLAICINIWYEVSVRSDLISNFLLLATFVNVLYRKNICFKDYPYLLSFIAGLWLSTRFSTAFPLYILFLSGWFVMPWKKKMIMPIVSIVTFLLTLLPFVLWDANSFLHYEYNPFALQTRQGHFEDVVIYFIVATIMAMKEKTKTQYYFYSAIILIIIPIVSYGNRMIRAGELQNIYDAWCDITYLDAAIPFVVMAICSIVCGQEAIETDNRKRLCQK